MQWVLANTCSEPDRTPLAHALKILRNIFLSTRAEDQQSLLSHRLHKEIKALKDRYIPLKEWWRFLSSPLT